MNSMSLIVLSLHPHYWDELMELLKRLEEA
jgi:hypothetical protein